MNEHDKSLDVPTFGENLDCFITEETLLGHLIDVFHTAPIAYLQYGFEKSLAQRQRRAGEINEALRHEHNCELYYKEIPDPWKW